MAAVTEILAEQRRYFATGKTRDVAFRKKQLRNLQAALLAYEGRVQDALKIDLGRHATESALVETMVCGEDVHSALSHIDEWVQDEPVSTPISIAPAYSFVRYEPKGNALVIAPWNYPFNLAISPVVSALAAGCTATVKPSEMTPNISKVIRQLIEDVFEPGLVACVEGGIEASNELLEQKWDHIFFTGSPGVGRIVMQKAAKHLTGVTLELGGKSPAFVTKKANIQWAGKRLAWGKLINAGQTCIAPDYVLVERSVLEPLIEAYKASVIERYGSNPKSSPDFTRIVNQRHAQRVANYIKDGTVRFGGEVDIEDRYVSPTVITDVKLDSPAMQEEIFGPVLPFIAIDNLDQGLAVTNALPRPLAMYVFSNKDAEAQYLMERQISGGVCVNDTVNQFVNHHLPFGGIGDSGVGQGHGRHGFLAFSHQRGVYERKLKFENPLYSAPYGDKLKTAKRLVPFVHLID